MTKAPGMITPTMVSDSAIAEMKMKALIQPGWAATQANRVLTNSECMVERVRIG